MFKCDVCEVKSYYCYHLVRTKAGRLPKKAEAVKQPDRRKRNTAAERGGLRKDVRKADEDDKLREKIGNREKWKAITVGGGAAVQHREQRRQVIIVMSLLKNDVIYPGICLITARTYTRMRLLRLPSGTPTQSIAIGTVSVVDKGTSVTDLIIMIYSYFYCAWVGYAYYILFGIIYLYQR